MTYTRGPWEIRSRHESRGEHSTVHRYVAIPGWDYIEVGRLTDPSEERDAELRSNARLLAAAPDLLTALQLVVDTYGFDSSTDSAIWKTACAAIEKATVPQS